MKLSWSGFARPHTAACGGTQRLAPRYRIERLAARSEVSILGRKFAEGFAAYGYRTKQQAVEVATVTPRASRWKPTLTSAGPSKRWPS